MIFLRCARGMHLDMNSQHTGFELYRVARRAEGFPSLGRPIDPEVEFEGPMPLTDGFVLRARKMIRRMTPVLGDGGVHDVSTGPEAELGDRVDDTEPFGHAASVISNTRKSTPCLLAAALMTARISLA